MANIKWVDGFKVIDGDNWRVVEDESVLSVASGLQTGELVVCTYLKGQELKRAALMVNGKVYKAEEVTGQFTEELAVLDSIVKELEAYEEN